MKFEPDAPIPAPVTPPKSWFEQTPDWFDPQGSLIQIDFESGRVAALVAPYTECILDGTGNCWTPPPSQTNYEYAHVGTMLTDEGDKVRVANIGGAIDHANLYANASVAADHYANTATRRMVGRYVDKPGVGILFLGSMWPGNTFGDAIEVMASALSGDWRYIKSLNDYEMCGSQLVNNPGFRPVPARAASFGMAQYACMAPEADNHPVMMSHWDTGQKGGEGTLEERLERLEQALITLMLLSVKDQQFVSEDFRFTDDGFEGEMPPPLPFRAAVRRRRRRLPGGVGKGRWDYRDPNTGKFAPLGYVSPQVLQGLNSDDPAKRRHAMLILKSKFDSPKAKPLIAEFAIRRKRGDKADDIARGIRKAVIGPRPDGTTSKDRKKQSAWDKAEDILAGAMWEAVDKIEDVEDYEDYIDNALSTEDRQMPGETTAEEIVEALEDSEEEAKEAARDAERAVDVGFDPADEEPPEPPEEALAPFRFFSNANPNDREMAVKEAFNDMALREGISKNLRLAMARDINDRLKGDSYELDRWFGGIDNEFRNDILDKMGYDGPRPDGPDLNATGDEGPLDEARLVREGRIRDAVQNVLNDVKGGTVEVNRVTTDQDGSVTVNIQAKSDDAKVNLGMAGFLLRVNPDGTFDINRGGKVQGPDAADRKLASKAKQALKKVGRVDMPDGDSDEKDLDVPEVDAPETGFVDATPEEIRAAAEAADGPIRVRVADNGLYRVGINEGDVLEVTPNKDGSKAVIRVPNQKGKMTKYDIVWKRFNGIEQVDDADVPDDDDDWDENDVGGFLYSTDEEAVAQAVIEVLREMLTESGVPESEWDRHVDGENDKMGGDPAGYVQTLDRDVQERILRKLGFYDDGEDEPDLPGEAPDEEAWRARKQPLVARVNENRDPDAARELADVLDEEAAAWEAYGDNDMAERRRNNATDMRALADRIDREKDTDTDTDGDDEDTDTEVDTEVDTDTDTDTDTDVDTEVDNGPAEFTGPAFAKFHDVPGEDSGFTIDGERVDVYTAKKESDYDKPWQLYVTESGRVVGRVRKVNYETQFDPFEDVSKSGKQAKYGKKVDPNTIFDVKEWVPEDFRNWEGDEPVVEFRDRYGNRDRFPARPIGQAQAGDRVMVTNGKWREIDRIEESPLGINVYFKKANGGVSEKPERYKSRRAEAIIQRDDKFLKDFNPDEDQERREAWEAETAEMREWLTAAGLESEDLQTRFLLFSDITDGFSMTGRELADDYYDGDVDKARAVLKDMEEAGLVWGEDINSEWERGVIDPYTGKRMTLQWQANTGGMKGGADEWMGSTRFERFERFSQRMGIMTEPPGDEPEGWGERGWNTLPDEPDVPDVPEEPDAPSVNPGYTPTNQLVGVDPEFVNTLSQFTSAPGDDMGGWSAAELVDTGELRYEFNNHPTALFTSPDGKRAVRLEWYADADEMSVTMLEEGTVGNFTGLIAMRQGQGGLVKVDPNTTPDTFRNFQPHDSSIRQLNNHLLGTGFMTLTHRDNMAVDGVLFTPANDGDLQVGFLQNYTPGWRTNAVKADRTLLNGDAPDNMDDLPDMVYWTLEPTGNPNEVRVNLVDDRTNNILTSSTSQLVDQDASVLFSMMVADNDPVDIDQPLVDKLRSTVSGDMDRINQPMQQGLGDTAKFLGYSDATTMLNDVAYAGHRKNGTLYLRTNEGGRIEVRPENGGTSIVAFDPEQPGKSHTQHRLPGNDFLTYATVQQNTDIPESVADALAVAQTKLMSNDPAEFADARQTMVGAMTEVAPAHRWGENPGLVAAISEFGKLAAEAARRREVDVPDSGGDEAPTKEYTDRKKAVANVADWFDNGEFETLFAELGVENLDELIEKSHMVQKERYNGMYENRGGEVGQTIAGKITTPEGDVPWAIRLEGEQITPKDDTAEREFIKVTMAMGKPGSYYVSLYGDDKVEVEVAGKHISKVKKFSSTVNAYDKAKVRDKVLSGADETNVTGRSQRQNAEAAQAVLRDMGVSLGLTDETRSAVRAGGGAGVMARGWRGRMERDTKITQRLEEAQTLDGKLKKDAKLVETGLSLYPDSWIRSIEGHTFLVSKRSGVSGKTGGYNLNLAQIRGREDSNASLISIPGESETGKDTIVHEVGHTMENIVPGLQSVVIAHLDQRHAPDDTAVQIGGYSRDVRGFEDEITRAYGRRVYGKGYGRNIHGTWATNRDRIGSTEYLTTGMEGLVDTNTDANQIWGVDEVHDAFILGVLATFEPTQTVSEAGPSVTL